MKWGKFIEQTFILKEWDYVNPETIKYIKNNFLTLDKKNIEGLSLSKKLTHHILIRLEYLKEYTNIRP